MHLGILARGFALTAPLREYVARRVGFALSRYAQAVRRVQIRLSDVNGPRGGADKQCVFHVSVAGSAPVIIRERDADAYVAVDRAADRVDRTIARLLSRRRILGIR